MFCEPLNGKIGINTARYAEEIIDELKKTYFYSMFVLAGTDKDYSKLDKKELNNTC